MKMQDETNQLEENCFIILQSRTSGYCVTCVLFLVAADSYMEWFK